jgi:hypothetical protein
MWWWIKMGVSAVAGYTTAQLVKDEEGDNIATALICGGTVAVLTFLGLTLVDE